MKAAQINGYGDNSVIKVVEDVQKPEILSDHVLVEVHATSINPFDVKLSQGVYKEFINLDFPATLGGDLAGTVAEIGSDVTGYSIGQKVYGMANAAGGQGSFAEYSPVAANQLASMPSNLSYMEAAAVPLTASSAYQALIDHMELQPGQKILIHGGAGGIGTAAIQIASSIGAQVYTSAVESDHEYVNNLGADTAIDYTKQDFSEVISDIDAVFDTVGGDTTTKSYKVLKDGGVLVSMLSSADDKLVADKNIRFIKQNTEVTPSRLAKITEMIEGGALKVVVDRVFKLDETGSAFEYFVSGHPKGKVVVQIN